MEKQIKKNRNSWKTKKIRPIHQEEVRNEVADRVGYTWFGLLLQELLEAYDRERADRMLLLGDILLHGHTHIPKCVEYEEYVYLNPSSISIPKEDSWHGYMTLEERTFRWKDLERNEKMYYTMK